MRLESETLQTFDKSDGKRKRTKLQITRIKKTKRQKDKRIKITKRQKDKKKKEEEKKKKR